MTHFTTLSDAELDTVCGGFLNNFLNAGAGGSGGNVLNGAQIVGGNSGSFLGGRGGSASGGFLTNNSVNFNTSTGGAGGAGGSINF